jgi:hypothetical protein
MMAIGREETLERVSQARDHLRRLAGEAGEGAA